MPNPTLVALVDDHVLLRNALAVLIDGFENYSVLLQADNGKQFIERCPSHQVPGIVLLDITMPVMNGYETAAWITANLPSTRILALSMMDNDNAVIRMIYHGARGYILKDCKPNTLKAALDLVRDNGYFMNDLVSNRVFKMLHNSNTPALYPGVNLTERETVFLRLACSEKTYKEIAVEMSVSARTVDGYRDGLFTKLGITSRVGLALYAARNGVILL